MLCYLTPSYLVIFAFTLFHILTLSGEGFGFDSFEHRYIGTEAYNQAWRLEVDKLQKSRGDWEKAVARLYIQPEKSRIAFPTQRLDAPTLPLEFGDLTALAGDFVDTPEDLISTVSVLDPHFRPDYAWDHIPLIRGLLDDYMPLWYDKHVINLTFTGILRIEAIRRQWESACSWIQKNWSPTSPPLTLRTCLRDAMKEFDKNIMDALEGGQNIYDPKTAAKGYEPLRGEVAAMERIRGFVGLVSQNKSHFPTESWDEYRRNHFKAVTSAKKYARKLNSDDSKIEDLKMALVYEALGQHYLQDSYAGGHLGVDVEKYGSWNFKELLQHVHDHLNKMGKQARLKDAFPEFYDSLPVVSKSSFADKSTQGWIAYGDRHLMTAEATFQRLLVVNVAAYSIRELFQAAEAQDYQAKTWHDVVFPRPDGFNLDKNPKELSASYAVAYDVRVPPLLTEGWYIFMGPGTLLGPTSAPGASFFNRGSASAYTVDLGYVRPTEPLLPNYFGLGFSQAPGVRTSIYPLSVGYWFPNEIFPDTGGLYWGYRLNVGARLDERGSFENSSSRNRVKAELGVVVDAGVQVYKPISLFLRLELLSTSVDGSIFTAPRVVSDSIFGNGSGFLTFGLRYQIVGVQ